MADVPDVDQTDTERHQLAVQSCTGDGGCLSPIHVHGCFADVDGKGCDDPGDHGPALVRDALRRVHAEVTAAEAELNVMAVESRARHARAVAAVLPPEVAPSIDAWTDLLARAAGALADKISHDWLPDLHGDRPTPVVAVHPGDLAAMRRAHSLDPTDGPIRLYRMAVVADASVPAREARLRYDVVVPL